MISYNNHPNFLVGLTTFVLIFAGAFSAYGQCVGGGVYLRHTSTQRFPYDKVYLDQAADMNGDGSIDLLASQNPGPIFSRNRLFVIPNNGSGVFGAPIVLDAPAPNGFSYKYFIGKVNTDSLNDIIAYQEYGGGLNPGTMMVYLNNGNGTFSAPVVSSVAGRGVIYELVDVNNDGKNDYMGFGGDFNYSLGNGDGTFGAPVMISSSDGIAASADINNDGKRDFFNARHVFINNGDGTFTSSDVSTYGIGSNESPYIVRDLNGDNRTDILVATPSGYRRLLRRVDGGWDSTTYNFPSDPANAQPVYQVGFYNGDPYIDILVTYRLLNKKVLFALDATGAPTRTEYDGRFYYFNFVNKVFADFDGDGREDVVQMNSGITNSSIMLRDVTSLTFMKNVCNRVGQPRIIEIDGTGNTDFSFWNPATGDWSFRANPYDQETNATETVNWGLGSHGDIPTPGDFDGDGVTDRAVYRNSTGVWYIRRSSDLSWYVLPFGLTGDKPVVADYDGDTISDIAVWRPSDGNWYIWYMGTQTYSITHFGSDGDKPAPADFDGDLKTDIAVYRPSTGIWYYLKSTNAEFVYVRWGLANDRAMPADFDGDGKADIAIWRDLDQTAYIVRSSDSAIVYFPFGNAHDLLQIGDYDGDFVADITVYRPSTRWWLTTADPVLFGAVFGADNIIPTSSVVRAE